MTKSTKIITLYKGTLKDWPKSAGKRPTEADMLKAATACARINKRPGGNEFLAVAMYFRDGMLKGATSGDVQAGCKSGTAVNVFHRLVNANAAVAVNAPNRADVKGGRMHKVYALALSEKKAPKPKAPKEEKAPAPKEEPAS